VQSSESSVQFSALVSRAWRSDDPRSNRTISKRDDKPGYRLPGRTKDIKNGGLLRLYTGIKHSLFFRKYLEDKKCILFIRVVFSGKRARHYKKWPKNCLQQRTTEQGNVLHLNDPHETLTKRKRSKIKAMDLKFQSTEGETRNTTRNEII
jgi:hypothetical protein